MAPPGGAGGEQCFRYPLNESGPAIFSRAGVLRS